MPPGGTTGGGGSAGPVPFCRRHQYPWATDAALAAGPMHTEASSAAVASAAPWMRRRTISLEVSPRRIRLLAATSHHAGPITAGTGRTGSVPSANGRSAVAAVPAHELHDLLGNGRQLESNTLVDRVTVGRE